MNEYKFLAEPINTKYRRSEANWYKRRLARVAMGQPFTETPPPHDLSETANQFGLKTQAFVTKLFK